MSELAMTPTTFPAIPVPHDGARWWAAIARFFTATIAEAAAPPRRRVDPPRRTDFLEHAAMGREMYRL